MTYFIIIIFCQKQVLTFEFLQFSFSGKKKIFPGHLLKIFPRLLHISNMNKGSENSSCYTYAPVI